MKWRAGGAGVVYSGSDRETHTTCGRTDLLRNLELGAGLNVRFLFRLQLHFLNPWLQQQQKNALAQKYGRDSTSVRLERQREIGLPALDCGAVAEMPKIVADDTVAA